MDYVALQVKTSYSLLNSLNHIPKLVELAKQYGYKSLAITDENNMFGVMEFYLECKKNNIKPIIGIELSIENKKILLYAKNKNGYKSLIKLSTIISERAVTKEDLRKYKDDLLLIMPFSFFDIDIFNIYNNKFVGYSNPTERDKIFDNKKIYINDVSYLSKDDYKYLDYLSMIKKGLTLGEYELNRYQRKHLLTQDEVSFIDNSELKDITSIVDMCNVDLKYQNDLLPIYNETLDAFEYLTFLCNKGLKKRLNNKNLIEYNKRLNYELKVIKKMGFCDYFLIVWDYVKYAKKNNILVGPGRGSAAGSLVSYTLGITDIDPIKYNLLFERFLNPERITMPDIDIDFDAEKRSDVINYVINKYGEKKVVGIITFNTLGAKQVIRDVGRIMRIDSVTIDDLSKKIAYNSLLDCYNSNKEFANYIDSSADLKKLYNICLRLEGLPRHISIHAAGIIMSRYNIDEIIPLYKNQLGIYTTGYSMNYLEDLGLLKMDFLGLTNLTLLSNLIKEINENNNLNITFSNIPLNDQKCLEIFYKVKTDGIFQFESPGMKSFLEKLKVTCFDDLVAAIALFRPGPMDNIDRYIKRRCGKEKIDCIHSDLEDILSPTYGIIIYQEQIMLISNRIAGYTYGEADLLRRAMSKKKEQILLREKPKFIRRSIENGYSEEVATNIYNLILKFANYGFNKSHSVAYAVIAYKMAFLKYYFFDYYVANLLTNSIGSEAKTNIYIVEAKKKDIVILLPDINESTNKYIVNKGTIRCPLSIIRNIGISTANEIIKERDNGKYLGIIDFIKRTYFLGINRKVIIALIESGCFDLLGYNKKTLINNLENIINYIELTKDAGLIEVEAPELIVFEEYNNEELTNLQMKCFGFYLGDHPVLKYKNTNSLNTSKIDEYFNKNIELFLYIESIKEIVTKKNDVMCFIKASDEFGFIDLTLFPKVYKKNNNLKKKCIIKVFGKVEKRFDKYQIIINSLQILS